MDVKVVVGSASQRAAQVVRETLDRYGPGRERQDDPVAALICTRPHDHAIDPQCRCALHHG